MRRLGSSAENRPEAQRCLRARVIWEMPPSSPKKASSPVCILAGGGNHIVLTTVDGHATIVLQHSNVPRCLVHCSQRTTRPVCSNWSWRGTPRIVISTIYQGGRGVKITIRDCQPFEGDLTLFEGVKCGVPKAGDPVGLRFGLSLRWCPELGNIPRYIPASSK